FVILANAYKHDNSKNKISDCCKAPGCPGWTNTHHKLNYYDIKPRTDIKTPKQCCQGCFKDPDCIQWSFGQDICRFEVERISQPLLSICNKTTGPPILNAQCGIMRCDDGCIPPRSTK
ncbi:11416_t:CDS:1, partial [Racocetra persica]